MFMCGGDSTVYTYNKTDLGLGIHKTIVYADGNYRRTDYEDTLLRQPECCWGKSPYKRPLTEEDVDPLKLNVQCAEALNFINDRREYMQRVAEREEENRQAESEERKSGCTLF